MPLTVIVAPRGVLAGVRDVLHDLAALDLLEPFLWCWAEDVDGVDARAVRIQGAGAQTMGLRHALMTGAVERVRLCVLVPVLEGAQPIPPAVEERVAALIGQSLSGVRVERLRCLVCRPGAQVDPGMLAREGWHNVLIAPEESPSPKRGHAVLRSEADAVDVGRHAGPTIAALLGLWVSVDEAPFDDEMPLPGRMVRLVRSFYRDLSAGILERALRDRVADVREGLPLVRNQGQAATHVQDVQLATSEMARALWSKHRDVLQGPRVKSRSTPAATVGALTAVRMLFGYLGATLRNAPGRWYAMVLNRASSGVAATVQRQVFGAEPSAYEVVVRGMTPSGLPASWQDELDAAIRLDDVLSAGDRDRKHEAPVQLGRLWRDYVNGALTLADAGERDAALPSVRIGSASGVLRRPQDCVPSSDHDFTALSGYLAATIGMDRVGACDVLGARTLRSRLEHLAGDDAAALDADRARGELGAWQAERGKSFGVQVGGVLARRIVEVGAEIRGYLRTMDELASAQAVDDATAARQRRLARWIRWVLTLALVAVVSSVALVLGGVLALAVGLGLIAAVLMIWLVSSLTIFLREQEALFQELNRRKSAVTEWEATQSNLRLALRDQRRLGLAYRQFLSWSAILGHFLEEPYGSPSAECAEDRLPVVFGLPVSSQLGVAVPDESAITAAAAALRRMVFSEGWLSEPFETALRAACERLGPEAEDLRRDGEAVFGLPSWPEPTLLTGLQAEMTARLDGDESLARLWSRVLEALDGPAADMRERLVREVRPSDGGAPVGTADFIGDFDWSGELTAQRFDPTHFARSAQASDRGDVDARRSSVTRRGLGTRAVITEISAGIPPYDLAAAAVDDVIFGADDVLETPSRPRITDEDVF